MTQRTPVGERYRASRERITEHLSALDADRWDVPVPACPGWDVHAVVAHLVGMVEDAAAGELVGPPEPEQTAREVDRHRHDDPKALLGRWAELAPPFEEVVSAVPIWPAFFDVLSHEHDLYSALGDVGARGADVDLAAKLLVRGVQLDRPLHVDTGDEVLASTGGTGEPLILRTTAFEAFRLRMGRRSRAQALAMDWSEDPTPWVDSLFIFGPAAHDLSEVGRSAA
jgi:uncharacterized protein (TIGR03083 family)